MSALSSRRHTLSALAAWAATTALSPRAEPLPSAVSARRLVVGRNAGSAIDVLSRRIARILGEQFQIDLEVENISGGGGVPSASRVLHAPADGRTLLLANSGLFSTVPVVMKDALRFDPVSELAPLAILVKTPFFLAASSQGPVRRFADFRSGHGDKLTHFGVTTLYGANHLAASLLFRRLDINAQAVSYTQDSQMLLDLFSARIPYAVFSWNNLRPLLDQGQVRALCVLSTERAPFAPTVPALGEFGLEDCAHAGWVGIFHRRDVAADAVQPCAQALHQVFTNRPPLLDVGEYGCVSAYLDAAHAATFMRRDIARHRSLLQQLALV